MARAIESTPREIERRKFGGAAGHLISREVLAIEYVHAQSARARSYRHDFDHVGAEMWALSDGGLLIRHPGYRLWSDRIVADNE